MKYRNTIGLIVLFCLLTGGFFAITNAQQINDWFKLRNYNPPKEVVKLADETTMKDDVRRIFYVNHPQLNGKSEFNQNCKTTEQSIVLGCFINNQGIYLLDVKDKRLDGVIEVTAAHETLHALYDRLSESERKKVDAMTSDFFSKLNNDRIKKTIENYRKKDPSVVPNELHSILGSEVRNLSPELEAYYAKYFNDRKRIVSYSEQYEQTFVDLRNKVDSYDAELSNIKKQIDDNQTKINQSNSDFVFLRKQMDSLLSSGRIDEYNAQVSVFNSKVNEYNALVNSTKQLINQYNELVSQRNSIAVEEQDLVKAIDSNSINKEKTR